MIVVSYGSDIAKSAYDALAASDIASHLKASYSVAIKPNLVVSGPASLGATTHPEVVSGIIKFLKDFGVSSIKIIESSWIGDNTKSAFKVCGFEELSREHGVPLVDLKDDSCTTLKHGGLEIAVCDEALNTDFLINVPVLKAHCQTRLTCCIKNLKGCIPDSEKRRFHAIGLHKPIGALGALIKTGYNVVDGICGDLTMEEGGNPVAANRIIAGRDPLLIDSFCAQLIGYMPSEIIHLAYAKEYGVGEFFSEKAKVVELNAGSKPANKASCSRVVQRYSKLVAEDAACSACYSSLMYALHRLGGKVSSKGKLHIGQGFKGKSGAGQGIGNCASGFDDCIPGCPPKAADIVKLLYRP